MTSNYKIISSCVTKKEQGKDSPLLYKLTVTADRFGTHSKREKKGPLNAMAL